MNSFPNRLSRGASAPWLAATSTIFLTAIYYMFGPAPEALVFDQSAIEGGQLWRLVTGHLVHCDDAHFVWNVAAFFILAVYIEARSRRAFLVSTLTGMVAVSGYLFIFAPSIETYCGLSGILNTYMVAAVFLTWQEGEKALASLAGFSALSKVAVEVFTPHALVGGISWEAVPETHAAGLLVGGLFFWLLYSQDEPISSDYNNNCPGLMR